MPRTAPRSPVRRVSIAATYHFHLLIIYHRTAPYVVKFSSHLSGAVRHRTARAANTTPKKNKKANRNKIRSVISRRPNLDNNFPVLVTAELIVRNSRSVSVITCEESTNVFNVSSLRFTSPSIVRNN
uniref:Uncharacterized protein n=1 Tax=Romanomermis culicivorax TaxID=13658 RepID=A0A915HY76_ROMCU